jgi:hypothetical protein
MSSKAELCCGCGRFAASNGVAGLWVRDEDGVWWVHETCVKPDDEILGNDVNQPPQPQPA